MASGGAPWRPLLLVQLSHSHAGGAPACAPGGLRDSCAPPHPAGRRSVEIGSSTSLAGNGTDVRCRRLRSPSLPHFLQVVLLCADFRQILCDVLMHLPCFVQEVQPVQHPCLQIGI